METTFTSFPTAQNPWQTVYDAASVLANDALLRTTDPVPHGDDASAAAVLAVLQAAHHLLTLTGEVEDTEESAARPRGALRFSEPVIRLHANPPATEAAEPRPVPELPVERQPHLLPYQRRFQERARGERRSPWDAASRPLTIQHQWLLIALSCIACLVIFALSAVLFRDWKAPVPVTQSAAPVRSAIEQTDSDVFASRSRMEHVVRAFHAATTPEEKAAFVRNGAALLSTLRAYYATHPVESPVKEMHPDTYNWVEFQGCTVVYGLLTGEDGAARQFTIQLSTTTCLLDWQALTGWTGVDWDEFLRLRPADPVTLCVLAAPDSLYAGPFSNRSDWICLKIEDPERSHYAWAYVRRNSAVAKVLPASFLADAGTAAGQTLRPAPKRLTLTLRIPQAEGPADGASQHGPVLLELTAVHREGWFDPASGGIPQ